MKKQFLLGLLAMTLPLSTWAQDKFEVTAQDIVYAGAETKPIITVKVGDNMAAEGTYAIAYSKDGKAVKAADIHDVGTYTAVVSAVGDIYFGFANVTKTFKVTPKKLSTVTLKEGAAKKYGDKLELSQLVASVDTLAVATDAVDSVKTAELENALNCLYTQFADDEVETAGGSYQVLVRGKKVNEITNSNYYYEEGSNIQGILVTVSQKDLTISLTDSARVYNGKETAVGSLGLKIEGVLTGENANITLAVDSNKTIKNAGTYTIIAKAGNTNYTINDSTLTYTIAKDTLFITPKSTTKLEKMYGSADPADFTALYDYTFVAGEDTSTVNLTMKREGGEGVKAYLVHPCVEGVAVSKVTTNSRNYATALENYVISYDRDNQNLKFKITAKEVEYWFEAKGKTYDSVTVTSLAANTDYVLAVDSTAFLAADSTLIGSFGTGTTPTPVFADTIPAKNAGTYSLKTNNDSLTVGNYMYVFNGEKENANVYEIKKGKMTITAPNKSIFWIYNPC